MPRTQVIRTPYPQPPSPQPRLAATAHASRASRLAAGVIVGAATVICVVVESFLVPLRIADVIVPVSVLLALVLHPLLTWLMWKGTRSRPAVFVPVAIWAVLVFFLGNLRPEGDAVIAGSSWVPIGFLLAGAVAFAVSVAVFLQRPTRHLY